MEGKELLDCSDDLCHLIEQVSGISLTRRFVDTALELTFETAGLWVRVRWVESWIVARLIERGVVTVRAIDGVEKGIKDWKDSE